MLHSLADLNREHRRFWKKQTAADQARWNNVSVRRVALGLLKDEELRGVDVSQRMTLSLALQHGAQARHFFRPPRARTSVRLRKEPSAHHADTRAFHREVSRRGGKSKGCDFLQLTIDRLVAARPRIRQGELLIALRSEPGIQEIGKGCVYFVFTDRRDRKIEDKSPIRALKDRLRRARDKLANSAKSESD